MKKILKITGIIFAIVIVGIFLAFINGFFGNPISRLIVKFASDKYIEEKYSGLSLEKKDVFYNFKTGLYTIFIQDKNSMDRKFEIGFDGLGRLEYDNSDDVLFNTYIRFDEVLRNYGKEIQEREKTDYEINLSIYGEEDYYDKLKLDEEVNLNNFPFSIEANVYGFRSDPNYEEALKILKNLNEIMASEPLKVKEYSIILIPEKDRANETEAQTWVNALTISNISEDLIKNGSAEDLKTHKLDMEKI